MFACNALTSFQFEYILQLNPNREIYYVFKGKELKGEGKNRNGKSTFKNHIKCTCVYIIFFFSK